MVAAAPSGFPIATVVAVVAWYFSNVAILITNKVLLNPNGFGRPITLTLGHAATCAFMGGLGAFFSILPWQPLQSTRQAVNVVWLSLVFSLTIVAANASLKDIPISFNQAIGSSTPFFTALFAFVCQGKRESMITYATLVPIVLGVVVASKSEPLFHLVGFSLCVMAAAGRAFKSVLQSMLMTNPAEQLNPHSLLFYMSSVCAVFLLPASLILEPGAFAFGEKLLLTRPNFTWWLVSNLVLSYAVNYTNFLVTKLTSALTLQVLGNAKGVVATVVSVLIFRNTISWRFVVGYAIVIAGVFMYSDSKRRHGAQAPTVSAEGGDGPRTPLLGGGGHDGSGTVVSSSALVAESAHKLAHKADMEGGPRGKTGPNMV